MPRILPPRPRSRRTFLKLAGSAAALEQVKDAMLASGRWHEVLY